MAALGGAEDLKGHLRGQLALAEQPHPPSPSGDNAGGDQHLERDRRLGIELSWRRSRACNQAKIDLVVVNAFGLLKPRLGRRR